MILSEILAERVAGRMRRYGHPECLKADVWTVYLTGTHPEDSTLAADIKQELSELQIEPLP